MIDLHIHILPGVDDGSYSVEESLRMAAMAAECGVTHMVITPHCNVPDEPHHLRTRELLVRLEELRQALAEAEIPLKLYPGMEIFGTPEVPRLLREGELTSLAGSRYPLVEFPFDNYGREATELLDALLRDGWRPVVAHPERYHYVQRSPELVNLWADMGCLLQVNRGSLLGRFGPGPERISHELLDRGFASFVASDAHRSTFRTPWLRDVYRLIGEEYSPRLARRLMEENPARILADREIETEEPDWF